MHARNTLSVTFALLFVLGFVLPSVAMSETQEEKIEIKGEKSPQVLEAEQQMGAREHGELEGKKGTEQTAEIRWDIQKAEIEHIPFKVHENSNSPEPNEPAHKE